ncbi:hypothetical protein N0K08_11940 [Acidovorax sp. Be4]|uniref:Uncharacterized protein n=1 Tax=Acidovorax bellezanensis TaxID=2976702 RepID=A0ABT2PLJ9_9BURK|nr:hypothetical protein [Acidovorax sp. Be4]MCT9811350.1 hypothetical protein [Acidovorax sp. Be4]
MNHEPIMRPARQASQPDEHDEASGTLRAFFSNGRAPSYGADVAAESQVAPFHNVSIETERDMTFSTVQAGASTRRVNTALFSS